MFKVPNEILRQIVDPDVAGFSALESQIMLLFGLGKKGTNGPPVAQDLDNAIRCRLILIAPEVAREFGRGNRFAHWLCPFRTLRRIRKVRNIPRRFVLAYSRS